MSTIDPVAARRAREGRPPGSARVILVLVLLFAGGLGTGYGWTMLAVAGWTEDPSALALAGIIAGMPLTIIASILWGFVVLKRRDLGMAYGFAAFWLGGGIGLFFAGRQSDEMLPVILAGAALLIAVFFAVTGLVAARARDSARMREREIMRTGTRTTATVSDKGYVIFSESTRIFTTVTFTFTDAQRVQRWVQRPMVVRAEDPVVDGQETDLWYDLMDPGNDKKIVVKLAVDSPLR